MSREYMRAIPVFESPEQYVEEKIDMLKRDFKIRLTAKELEHLHSLTTEISIDNACDKLISKKLNE